MHFERRGVSVPLDCLVLHHRYRPLITLNLPLATAQKRGTVRLAMCKVT